MALSCLPLRGRTPLSLLDSRVARTLPRRRGGPSQEPTSNKQSRGGKGGPVRWSIGRSIAPRHTAQKSTAGGPTKNETAPEKKGDTVEARRDQQQAKPDTIAISRSPESMTATRRPSHDADQKPETPHDDRKARAEDGKGARTRERPGRPLRTGNEPGNLTEARREEGGRKTTQKEEEPHRLEGTWGASSQRW